MGVGPVYLTVVDRKILGTRLSRPRRRRTPPTPLQGVLGLVPSLVEGSLRPSRRPPRVDVRTTTCVGGGVRACQEVPDRSEERKSSTTQLYTTRPSTYLLIYRLSYLRFRFLYGPVVRGLSKPHHFRGREDNTGTAG